MSAKRQDSKTHSKHSETEQPKSARAAEHSKDQPHGTREKSDVARDADSTSQKDKNAVPDRTGGQNGAVDLKRNDEQQYYAAGTAHDPHNRTQERVDNGDPAAGDVDQETRSDTAPFNKTYGHHA